MMRNRMWSWLSQSLGVVLMLVTILVPHDLQVGNVWPEWAHAFYLSFEKVSFTFGIYLLILPTLLEVPNMAFFLLDTKFFNFVSKISFWVYLFHFMVVEFVSYGEKVDFYYTPETIVPLYLAIATLSMFFGFWGTMLVEVPFSKLEKMLFSVLLKNNDRAKKSPESSDSILVNGKESIVHSVDPSTSGGELNEALLKHSDKENHNINRSVNE
jgi:peptidoglycan/LPS O-acetylase OafA/YrhL